MANVYLNEFDRFMVHHLKPLAYMRYGDDFLCFTERKAELESIYAKAVDFLESNLSLRINPKIESFQPAYKGISYLGVEIWPNGRRLNKRMRRRINDRLDKFNYASYEALVLAHENRKRHKELQWSLLNHPKTKTKIKKKSKKLKP